MHQSFVNALARQLNVDAAEAEQRLRAIAGELARALGESDGVEIPSVGRFTRSNGSVVFEPDDALLQAVNLDLETLGPVTLPGRPGATPPVTPIEPPDEEPEDALWPPLEEEDASLLPFEEPDTVFESGVEEEEDEEAEEAEEFEGLERLAEPELEEEPSDPVAYWNEEAFDEAEEEDVPPDEADFHEEETDDRYLWHTDEPELPLSPADETGVPSPGFAELPDEVELSDEGPALPDYAEMRDDPEVEDPPMYPVSGGHIDLRADDDPDAEQDVAPAVVPHPARREDRPPERHAEAHPVQERPEKRRRSLVPILLVGFLLLGGLAVAAYFYLQPSDDVPAVAQQRPTEQTPLAADEADEDAPGGLADSLVVPPTGAPAETVTDAEDLAGTSPETEPPSAPATAPTTPATPSTPPASAEPPIDVTAGGWTIVVGSATSAQDAQRIAARFRQQGHDAAVLYGPYGGVTRYRVVIRQFRTENEAIAFLQDAPDAFPTDAWRMRISSGLEVIPR